MIVVRLTGGLGNQMFQYAAARRLAIRHNTKLKLDLSVLESGKERIPRTYELKHLNINATPASSLEIAEITGKYNGTLQIAVSRLRRVIGLSKIRRNVYAERHFHFDSGVIAAADDIYLSGYWQSEKYFKDIGGIIRDEFIVKYDQSESNRLMADKITAAESVSIHVRRGDYVSDKVTNEFHGVCSLDYYQEAIRRIVSQVRTPYFFIFSDDHDWAKENLSVRCPHFFVDHNGPEKAYEDLRLIGLCKHHIIANSSFSWWGAWLSKNHDKRVIAPSRWFNAPGYDIRDLFPESWQSIDIK